MDSGNLGYLYLRPLIIMKLIIALIFAVLVSCKKETNIPPMPKKQLSFSDTQVWDVKLTEYFEQTPVLLPDDWRQKIHVADPPSNSSEVTLKELSYLNELGTQQEGKMEEIQGELDLPNATFGDEPIGNIDKEKFSQSIRLLQAINYDAELVVINLKRKYDRVRPAFLDKKLQLAIENPNHPAYPSGHSTQAHLLALVLGDLNPKKKKQYWKNASRIAHNREIAGVHYPSDTQAGISLAKQLHAILSADTQYLRLLSMAQDEWGKE